MNHLLAKHVIEEIIKLGISEFCVAAGSRNAPLVFAIDRAKQVKAWYWSEERSAGFFSIGRIKATKRPVAVVTTSATASAELFPAVMSAHYLGLPLVMLTADRPRRFRGSGAPQTAEHVGMFGDYVHFALDIADGELCDLSNWKRTGPAHINICFEEPNEVDCQLTEIDQTIAVDAFNRNAIQPFCLNQSNMLQSSFQKMTSRFALRIRNCVHATASIGKASEISEHVLTEESLINDEQINESQKYCLSNFFQFIEKTSYPLVVIGSLDPSAKEWAIEFLLKLKAPVYAEGTSNLREDDRLKPLRITRIDQVWKHAAKNGYPIDGILRIGEIPTARLWRDLEEKEGKVNVCSISELPFSGLSWSTIYPMNPIHFFNRALEHNFSKHYTYQEWLEADRYYYDGLLKLFHEEPNAEQSLFYALSCHIEKQALVYLGNSLPIREWDLAATYHDKHYQMHASRGVNGIDGQISTFLGLADPKRSNWAIIGDLTALYDMVGPWILTQMENIPINIVIVNNGGGQIFSRMYTLKAFINPHQLCFEPLADFWKMKYEKWDSKFSILNAKENVGDHRLIEIIPDEAATQRFWKKVVEL